MVWERSGSDVIHGEPLDLYQRSGINVIKNTLNNAQNQRDVGNDDVCTCVRFNVSDSKRYLDKKIYFHVQSNETESTFDRIDCPW